ncbi:PqqD family protein [Streptomyces sp. NPDC127084]|uniref:PqqD family protein n=1 Tax=Streptomyces sp. NPDC127084 TaxID=3347133 RepID=UPI003649D941
MSTVNTNDVVIRRLDVTVRVTDQVVELSESHEGGLLVERLIGRYVLDADARKVWRLIDGRRSVGRIVEDLAKESGLPASEIERPVHALCDRLLELDILEVATPEDTAALAQPACAG